MPADRIVLPAERVVACVEAVIAGAAIETAAAEAGVDPGDLTDAVHTYRAGGLAALQRRQEHAWFQAYIQMPDWASAEATFATSIAPRLDQLDGGHPRWWFLRKHPCWRLRIRTADRDPVAALLADLLAAGTIERWRPTIYEPESAAFGGPTAMTIVHDLFCVDSAGVLAYARRTTSGLGRRELSLLLIRALQQHAGLDWFEAADVFDRVATMRPTPADTDQARLDALTASLRPLLAIPVHTDTPLFAPAGPAAFATSWLAGFIEAGQRLGEAATTGRLDRGLRATIAHIVIFHWNRLGLSAAAQGILAHAAKTAILPRS